MSTAPLPTRDGISPSFVWLPEGQWQNALDFLCDYFPDIGEQRWLQRFARKEVVSADGAVLNPNSPVQRGLCIFYYREVDNEITIPFQENILFQDDNLMVVDKPHFLPVTPGGQYLKETLLTRLKRRTGIDELSPLHRLDRETAGVILLSTQASSRGKYQALFQQRQIEKTYHAIAPHLDGLIFPYRKQSRISESEKFFVMRELPGEANSDTLISILERRGANSLYQLMPSTGRKHQLRLHMASLGAPILNDNFYPIAQPAGSDDFEKPLKLLAKSIAFKDPVSGLLQSFHSAQDL